MSDLAVQNFSTVGLSPAFTAATAGGDTFVNSGITYLFVKNGGASSINATINAITPCNQGFDHDLVVAVAAGQTAQIGPLAANRFNDNTGRVGITYSSATSVTVAAVRT